MDKADNGARNRLAALNLLAPATGATSAADGAKAAPAATIQIGSTASVIQLATADAANFVPGSMIAVDADYTGQTGCLGSPVSGTYVRQPLTDVDYIRRITFNVALVLGVSTTSLILAQPLPGGAPAAGTKTATITGFVDREGGSFLHEWSALFVMQGGQGDHIFFHYPRLQSIAGAEVSATPLDNKHQGGSLRAFSQRSVPRAPRHRPSRWRTRALLLAVSSRQLMRKFEPGLSQAMNIFTITAAGFGRTL